MLLSNSIQWTDPVTWPWFMYLWIVVLLSRCGGPSWRWFQRKRAAKWPTAEGHIESAEVVPPKTTLFSRRGSVAILGYSYSVTGSPETGVYRRHFATEQEAWDFVRDLKDRPVAIHYNPDTPSSSSLPEPALEMLQRNRAPALGGESYSAYSVPRGNKRFLGVFIWIAALGLGTSMWIHLGALMGRRVAPEGFLLILHLGIFVVWLPALITAMGVAGTGDRRAFWKLALKGSPAWMRFAVYGFIGYSVVNFLLTMTTAQEASSGTTSLANWRGFSGMWMAFYFAAFAIFYTAAHAKQTGWRCPNGHAVPAGARYCEVCGQPLMRGSGITTRGFECKH